MQQLSVSNFMRAVVSKIVQSRGRSPDLIVQKLKLYGTTPQVVGISVMPAFGQTAFGQNSCFKLFWPCVCVFKIFGGCLQDFGASPLDTSSPSAGPPKISLFFFSLPPEVSFFLPSLGGLLVEFWWCLKRQDPQMCTLGLSGCRVKTRRLRGRRGFTRQPENSKRAHLSAPALQTPPKFHEKTPQEREEKKEH